MGRRWYGVDWWFVVLSSIAVIAFIIIAIFPQAFAPYSPDALVGPRFLAARRKSKCVCADRSANSAINS